MVLWKKYYNVKIKKFIYKKYIDDLKILLYKNHQVCNYTQIYFNNLLKSFFTIFKSFYFKINQVIQNYINYFLNYSIIFKNIELKCYQSCFSLMLNHIFLKQFFLVFYIIYFNFSTSNTILQVLDSIGNSKIFYVAGVLGLKGKQKIIRKLVLIRLFSLLFLLKKKFIKNSPVSLHLKNVGFSKFFIIKKLKRKFFIQIIKSFEFTVYNGCRKKKERRKR